MPPYPPRAFLFLNQLQIIVLQKKKNARKNVEITPNPLLKFLSTPMSAVYQHFSNEGSKFRSKVAVKTPRIVTQSFLYTFVCFCKLSLKKTVAKFDQELSACWEKSYDLSYRLPTH